MKKEIRNLLILSLILVSCNENRVYESYEEPSGILEWNKGETLKFDIDIIDTSIKYNHFITFRHATGYSFSACSLKIKETLPSGEVLEHFTTLHTANSEGYISECSGDICDLEELWYDNRKFTEVGIYNYEISHEMTEDKLHMVMEVGMIVDKIPEN